MKVHDGLSEPSSRDTASQDAAPGATGQAGEGREATALGGPQRQADVSIMQLSSLRVAGCGSDCNAADSSGAPEHPRAWPSERSGPPGTLTPGPQWLLEGLAQLKLEGHTVSNAVPEGGGIPLMNRKIVFALLNDLEVEVRGKVLKVNAGLCTGRWIGSPPSPPAPNQHHNLACEQGKGGVICGNTDEGSVGTYPLC
jgi:hypothetical protein